MEQLSLADLLKLLLSLPMETPVYATPSFEWWLRPGEIAVWPPPSRSEGILCLVDTRDRIARRSQGGWARVRAGNHGAALVIAGSGQPGSPLRRALRRLRSPGTMRLDERRVASLLECLAGSVLQKLSFEDGLEVPTDFNVKDTKGSTGTAYILTLRPAFTGSLWTAIADHLGDSGFETVRVQLRVRGAAVIVVRSRGRDLVVRAVPPGHSQAVVLRNHTRLLEVRGALRSADILKVMPEPLFAEMHDRIALLGETFLSGTPAWQIPLDLRRRVVHPQAVAYLSSLAADTSRSAEGTREALEARIREDLQCLDEASFVEVDVRRLLQAEIETAADLLARGETEATTSHGDFGYGNILVDDETGDILGVIDWDAARVEDFPGIDRVNLEIQIRRTDQSETFPAAVRSAWQSSAVRHALDGAGGEARVRVLFGLALSRYVLRALSYPTIYQEEAEGFRAALAWLASTFQAPADHA